MLCYSKMSVGGVKNKPFLWDSKCTRNSQVKPFGTVGTDASPAHVDYRWPAKKKAAIVTTGAALRLLILSKHRGTKALVSNQKTPSNPWQPSFRFLCGLPIGALGSTLGLVLFLFQVQAPRSQSKVVDSIRAFQSCLTEKSRRAVLDLRCSGCWARGWNH